MKNTIIGILIFCLFALIAIQKDTIVKAAGQYWRTGANASQMQTSATTTLPAFLVSGIASSTMMFATGDCSALTVTAQLFASSTNTQSWLQIDRFASLDGSTFYNYDTSLIGQSVRTGEKTLASSTQPITWKPSIVGATTTKVFPMDLIPALFTKLVFGIGSTTNSTIARDNANIWVNVGCSSQLY